MHSQADLVADWTVTLILIQSLAVATPILILLSVVELNLIQRNATAATAWDIWCLLSTLQTKKRAPHHSANRYSRHTLQRPTLTSRLSSEAPWSGSLKPLSTRSTCKGNGRCSPAKLCAQEALPAATAASAQQSKFISGLCFDLKGSFENGTSSMAAWNATLPRSLRPAYRLCRANEAHSSEPRDTESWPENFLQHSGFQSRSHQG